MNNPTSYTKNSNFQKPGAIFKKMLFAIVLLIFPALTPIFAQIVVTAPSLTVAACPAFPTSAGTLGDLVITETLVDDISGSGTVILSAPTNFEFTSAGTASATGTEITGVSVVLDNATTLTLTFTVSGLIELNAITLSGIQAIGINAATPASNITHTGGTATFNINVNVAIHAILTSTLSPVLSSTLSPDSICSGTAFSYTPTSAATGATFTWTRPVVVGISNLAGNGTDNPNETLTNSTSDSVFVLYIYSVTANGCTNPDTDSVIVEVNALSTSSSSATADPNPVLPGDSTLLTQTGGSLGTDAIYNWYSGTCGGTLVGTGDSIYVTPSALTTYFVRAEGTCNTTSCVSVLVDQISGIIEKNRISGITVFPNPFASQTTISFTKELKNATLKIVDVLGKEVKVIEVSGNQLILRKGELRAGVYFIQIILEKELIANQKVVIQ
ncbi:MAG: T9SS type A sorting domain-containing protein [Bacteroidetes bacterium]|nr:T9SS type A sorting domain-containing protein [Bacteroidota bacterium]